MVPCLPRSALSAVVRAGEKIAVGTCIEILRGMQTPTIARNHYNELKTFGVGKDVSVRDWQTYLLQMLQMGFFEVAYNMHNQMKRHAVGLEAFSKESTRFRWRLWRMKTCRTVRREEEVREEELQEVIWDMAEAVHPAVIFLSEIITFQWYMQSV